MAVNLFLWFWFANKKIDAHADLNAEDVVRGAGEFGVFADVAAEIDDVDGVEVAGEVGADAGVVSRRGVLTTISIASGVLLCNASRSDTWTASSPSVARRASQKECAPSPYVMET